MTHRFETKGLPPDYYGREFCGVCNLPGELGDPRHVEPLPVEFPTFIELAEPVEHEEVGTP